MTNLLAIETATTACSVALSYQDNLYQQHQQIPREHNKILLNMIQSVMAQASANFQNLDAVVVGHGPGSFVGTRIAVSVAQGIAFAADKSIVPVSTLHTIAQGAYRRHQCKSVWVAVDAHANQIYQQQFQYDPLNQFMQPCSNVSAIAPEDLIALASKNTIYAIGDGWSVYADKIIRPDNIKPLTEWLPNAIDLLPIATDALAKGHSVLPQHVQPIYVRGTSPWQKQHQT